ncbi:hypothetical protein CsSME_00054303 [Camellia sinensis var. sinensis]
MMLETGNEKATPTSSDEIGAIALSYAETVTAAMEKTTTAKASMYERGSVGLRQGPVAERVKDRWP